MRISDWSSDVCSSDLGMRHRYESLSASSCSHTIGPGHAWPTCAQWRHAMHPFSRQQQIRTAEAAATRRVTTYIAGPGRAPATPQGRSEEHTSELQSLMRISYAVFCLKKKKNTTNL